MLKEISSTSNQIIKDIKHLTDEAKIWQKTAGVHVAQLKYEDPNLKYNACYQYAIKTKRNKLIFKSDPYGYHFELRPNKASRIYNLDGYKIKDARWMKSRAKKQSISSPINIYEVHLGSWMRHPDRADD